MLIVEKLENNVREKKLENNVRENKWEDMCS